MAITRSPSTARRALTALAVARVGAGLLAIPLFPFLYREHFLVLVFMRPTQGILLAGAFLARQGHVSLVQILLAAIPLQVLAIWLYFGLGRTWADCIDRDDELPFLVARVLNRDQVRRLRKTLERKGARIAFLCRFALAPTGLVSATEGASELEPRRYLTADAAGLFTATLLSVGAGYGLGMAQDAAGPWLVAAGVTGLVALSATLTLILRRDDSESDSADSAGDGPG